MITARIIPFNKKPGEVPESSKDIRYIATRPVIQIILENMILPELKKLC